MMRLLRTVVVIMFIATAAVFAKYYYTNIMSEDKTYPEITVEEEELVVRADVSEEELLKGVSAFDEKDGDLTDKVIVESISKFYEPGVCKINYAVCDSNNHVARATRRLIYKNYESPKFTFTQPLLFTVGERINLSAIVGAQDVVDGDLNQSVIVTSSDYKSGQQGTFHADMKVSNSKGDIVRLRVPMFVEERAIDAPSVELSTNIAYTSVNKKPDYREFLVSAVSAEGAVIDLSKVEIKSEVKIKEEGAYAVHYYVTDTKGRQGHTVLTVVVES